MKTLTAALMLLAVALTPLSHAAPAVELDWTRDPAAEVRTAKPVVLKTESGAVNADFPVSDADLRVIAVRLADAANDLESQNMVGELYSYACTYSAATQVASCDFRFNLDRGICWYGYEHIKADFALVGRPKVLRTERFWSAD